MKNSITANAQRKKLEENKEEAKASMESDKKLDIQCGELKEPLNFSPIPMSNSDIILQTHAKHLSIIDTQPSVVPPTKEPVTTKI